VNLLRDVQVRCTSFVFIEKVTRDR
jgi:hypothetical protein